MQTMTPRGRPTNHHSNRDTKITIYITTYQANRLKELVDKLKLRSVSQLSYLLIENLILNGIKEDSFDELLELLESRLKASGKTYQPEPQLFEPDPMLDTLGQ